MSWCVFNNRFRYCLSSDSRNFSWPLWSSFFILRLVWRLFLWILILLTIYNFCYSNMMIINIMLIWVFVLFIHFFRLIKSHDIFIIATKKSLVIRIHITSLRLFEFRVSIANRFSRSDSISFKFIIFFISSSRMDFTISLLIFRYQWSNFTRISAIWILNRLLRNRSATMSSSLVDIIMISAAANSVCINKWTIHFLCFLWLRF